MAVNWTSITDFAQIPAVANSASGGAFWVGILYMIWIVMFLVLIAYGFEVAIVVSSFLALIIGIMLGYADLINFTYDLTFAGILLFMFLYIVWSSKKQ